MFVHLAKLSYSKGLIFHLYKEAFYCPAKFSCDNLFLIYRNDLLFSQVRLEQVF